MVPLSEYINFYKEIISWNAFESVLKKPKVTDRSDPNDPFVLSNVIKYEIKNWFIALLLSQFYRKDNKDWTVCPVDFNPNQTHWLQFLYDSHGDTHR